MKLHFYSAIVSSKRFTTVCHIRPHRLPCNWGFSFLFLDTSTCSWRSRRIRTSDLQSAISTKNWASVASRQYWMSIINRMRIKHNVNLLILSCFLIESTNQSINLHSGILKHDRINGITSLEFFFLLPQLKVSRRWMMNVQSSTLEGCFSGSLLKVNVFSELVENQIFKGPLLSFSWRNPNYD